MTTKLEQFRQAAIRVYAAAREIKICIERGYYMNLSDYCERYNSAFYDIKSIARELIANDKIEDITPDFEAESLTIRWRSGVETTYNYL